MHPAVSAEQWAGIRALREGEPATFSRLAAASTLHVTTIKEKSSREGWKSPPKRSATKAAEEVALAAEVVPEGGESSNETPEARLGRVMDFLLREVEAIGRTAQRQGKALDKARIDAVWSMIRMLEKVEGFALARAGENQTRRDGEMADVLRRIDERIVELAHAYAKELVAGQRDGERGGADPR